MPQHGNRKVEKCANSGWSCTSESTHSLHDLECPPFFRELEWEGVPESFGSVAVIIGLKSI